MLGAKPTSLLMNHHICLHDDQLKFYSCDYRSIIGKLFYVTVTHDISFAVRRLKEFMNKPRKINWEATLVIVKYLKSSPRKKLLFKKRCTFKY